MRALAALALLLSACAPSLPDYGGVPAFTLTAEDGSSFGSAQLAGSPWLVDFIYTTCPGPCPALSSRMAALQRKLPEAVKLVSVTVDPARDTPRALRAYAARFGAQPGRWRFLTGSSDAIRGLSRDGFKLALASGPGGAPIHSLKIALVDRRLRVRGYYDGDDPLSLERLARDAAALASRAD